MEPLLKKVKFTPVQISVSAIPTVGKSTSDVIIPTTNLLYAYFTYNNSNSDMRIGNVFSSINAQRVINDRFFNPYIGYAQITNLSVTSCEENEYQFILPKDFIDRIKNYELNNPSSVNLTGLGSFYEPKVS
jgi:hypothetical protein